MSTRLQDLKEIVKNCLSQDSGIQIVNISTEDGFVIAHGSKQDNEQNIEKDKVAAMASSLSSISNSSIKMLSNSEYNILTIEAEKINLVLIRAKYEDKNCVISLGTHPNISLARARFMVKTFGEEVSAF